MMEKSETSLDFSKREQRVMKTWLRLVRTAKHIESKINSQMPRTHGIRFVRFDVLSQLFRSPDGRMNEDLKSIPLES